MTTELPREHAAAATGATAATAAATDDGAIDDTTPAASAAQDMRMLLTRMRRSFSARFSLHDDKAHDEIIDENLRGGVELRGATVWILMFAILIASVGLNVNSTAVIIGAMLVSPLMGPIMGIGYGVGIYDFALIKKSLFNLGIATMVSLVTSAVYFSLSPLSDAQSELLSRTTPTIWDVMIALFGGLAGIVGATRREKSNVIPGVAIATALMPPLCTAGYGIANGNWLFFAGAFYLFAINCVFIAFSTVIIISVLRLPHRRFVDAHVEKRVRNILFLVIFLTILPSVYLAVKLVRDEIFNADARNFVNREFNFKQTHVAEIQIAPREKQIEVSLIGEAISPSDLKAIKSRLERDGLAGASIVVHQASGDRIDLTALKAGIVSDLYRDSQRVIEQKEEQIRLLKEQLVNFTKLRNEAKDVALELKAQYPQLNDIVIGEGVEPIASAPGGEHSVFILSAKSAQSLAQMDRDRVGSWFQARVKSKEIRFFIDAPLELVIQPVEAVVPPIKKTPKPSKKKQNK
jgi:uncharacterized hydrophobic protein (TIGR00271 family)